MNNDFPIAAAQCKLCGVCYIYNETYNHICPELEKCSYCDSLIRINDTHDCGGITIGMRIKELTNSIISLENTLTVLISRIR